MKIIYIMRLYWIAFRSHLPRCRADGTGNSAAYHTALLAPNNLTASRKGGVPSLAWLVCVAASNRPCPTMHPSLQRSIARECGHMKFYKSVFRCVSQHTVTRIALSLEISAIKNKSLTFSSIYA